MGLQTFVLLAAPSVSAFEFLGYGLCLDHNRNKFERFSVGSLPDFYVDDLSQCACPQCDEFCLATPGCIGYEFGCSAIHERFIALGAVLFSKGTRPEVEVSLPFSTLGYYGSPTTGDEFQGEGPIAYVDGLKGAGTSSFCYGNRNKAGVSVEADVSSTCQEEGTEVSSHNEGLSKCCSGKSRTNNRCRNGKCEDHRYCCYYCPGDTEMNSTMV